MSGDGNWWRAEWILFDRQPVRKSQIVSLGFGFGVGRQSIPKPDGEWEFKDYPTYAVKLHCAGGLTLTEWYDSEDEQRTRHKQVWDELGIDLEKDKGPA